MPKKQQYPYPPGIRYIPQRPRYPDFRVKGPYQGFDPMDYCRQLRDRVRVGEISWETANALWRQYADSVSQIYIDMPKPGPCSLSESPPLAGWAWGRVLGYPIWR